MNDIYISLGDSGLVVATSTGISEISTSERALAAFIMSGLGGTGESTSIEGKISMASSTRGDNASFVEPFDSAAPMAFGHESFMLVVLIIFWTFAI